MTYTGHMDARLAMDKDVQEKYRLACINILDRVSKLLVIKFDTSNMKTDITTARRYLNYSSRHKLRGMNLGHMICFSIPFIVKDIEYNSVCNSTYKIYFADENNFLCNVAHRISDCTLGGYTLNMTNVVMYIKADIIKRCFKRKCPEWSSLDKHTRGRISEDLRAIEKDELLKLKEKPDSRKVKVDNLPQLQNKFTRDFSTACEYDGYALEDLRAIEKDELLKLKEKPDSRKVKDANVLQIRNKFTRDFCNFSTICEYNGYTLEVLYYYKYTSRYSFFFEFRYEDDDSVLFTDKNRGFTYSSRRVKYADLAKVVYWTAIERCIADYGIIDGDIDYSSDTIKLKGGGYVSYDKDTDTIDIVDVYQFFQAKNIYCLDIINVFSAWTNLMSQLGKDKLLIYRYFLKNLRSRYHNSKNLVLMLNASGVGRNGIIDNKITLDVKFKASKILSVVRIPLILDDLNRVCFTNIAFNVADDIVIRQLDVLASDNCIGICKCGSSMYAKINNLSEYLDDAGKSIVNSCIETLKGVDYTCYYLYKLNFINTEPKFTDLNRRKFMIVFQFTGCDAHALLKLSFNSVKRSIHEIAYFNKDLGVHIHDRFWAGRDVLEQVLSRHKEYVRGSYEQ